ncbi:MAG: 2,3,4,5-tetrahydropyridine-2,6-dicarboxylate N-succinyltransferase, partial [Gammaproteobacteria bacterium]|nr:2,3,4,5-tetrahydropyridine-2,6-dicarboxylate N-succinyltransferase [Gammaproteobacteria bacterium]
MPHQDLQACIERAFESRAGLSPASAGAELREAVHDAIELLDRGEARVAERDGAAWRVNEWLKKAVLLSFRIADNARVHA